MMKKLLLMLCATASLFAAGPGPQKMSSGRLRHLKLVFRNSMSDVDKGKNIPGNLEKARCALEEAENSASLPAKGWAVSQSKRLREALTKHAGVMRGVAAACPRPEVTTPLGTTRPTGIKIVRPSAPERQAQERTATDDDIDLMSTIVRDFWIAQEAKNLAGMQKALDDLLESNVRNTRFTVDQAMRVFRAIEGISPEELAAIEKDVAQDLGRTPILAHHLIEQAVNEINTLEGELEEEGRPSGAALAPRPASVDLLSQEELDKLNWPKAAERFDEIAQQDVADEKRGDKKRVLDQLEGRMEQLHPDLDVEPGEEVVRAPGDTPMAFYVRSDLARELLQNIKQNKYHSSELPQLRRDLQDAIIGEAKIWRQKYNLTNFDADEIRALLEAVDAKLQPEGKREREGKESEASQYVSERLTDSEISQQQKLRAKSQSALNEQEQADLQQINAKEIENLIESATTEQRLQELNRMAGISFLREDDRGYLTGRITKKIVQLRSAQPEAKRAAAPDEQPGLGLGGQAPGAAVAGAQPADWQMSDAEWAELKHLARGGNREGQEAVRERMLQAKAVRYLLNTQSDTNELIKLAGAIRTSQNYRIEDKSISLSFLGDRLSPEDRQQLLAELGAKVAQLGGAPAADQSEQKGAAGEQITQQDLEQMWTDRARNWGLSQKTINARELTQQERADFDRLSIEGIRNISQSSAQRLNNLAEQILRYRIKTIISFPDREEVRNLINEYRGYLASGVAEELHADVNKVKLQ